MGNSITCGGKYHDGTDTLGAPRQDGKDRLGREALNQQLISTRLLEDVLGVCVTSSSVSSQNSKQREEVEDIMLHFSEQASCTIASTLSSATDYSTPSFELVNSQMRFMEPDQTIIIFDWDDTLCPSSWMRRHSGGCRGNPSKVLSKASVDEETANQLEQLTNQVIPLLRAAQAMGKVVLVTNARRPWVDTSCSKFLPKVLEHLKTIDVVYAMEYLTDTSAPLHVTSDTLTESKARAMRAAVSDFYSKYENQSWKNIISVGDALYEHDAIRQVARDRPGTSLMPGFSKKCRTKTVKLIESPTIPGMVMQLSLLENWLAKVVLADGDVAIDFAAPEPEIRGWIDMYGNNGAIA